MKASGVGQPLGKTGRRAADRRVQTLGSGRAACICGTGRFPGFRRLLNPYSSPTQFFPLTSSHIYNVPRSSLPTSKAAYFNTSCVSEVQQLRGSVLARNVSEAAWFCFGPVVFSANLFPRKVSGFQTVKSSRTNALRGAPRSQMPGDVNCTSVSSGTWLPRQGPSWVALDPVWLLCPALDRNWGSSFGP